MSGARVLRDTPRGKPRMQQEMSILLPVGERAPASGAGDPLLRRGCLDNGRWVEVGVWRDDTDARIPHFDDVPLNVGACWDEAEASGSASEP